MRTSSTSARVAQRNPTPGPPVPGPAVYEAIYETAPGSGSPNQVSTLSVESGQSLVMSLDWRNPLTAITSPRSAGHPTRLTLFSGRMPPTVLVRSIGRGNVDAGAGTHLIRAEH